MNVTELARKLNYKSRGTNLGTIKKYLDNNKIDYSHFTGRARGYVASRTPENTFLENSTAARKVVRKLYYEKEYTEYKCSLCGQEPFWNGKPLSLTLDHINGKNTDHRLENLRWVCPNCDRQLETFGSKNIGINNIGNENPRLYN